MNPACPDTPDSDQVAADRMLRLTKGLRAAQGSPDWLAAVAALRELADQDPDAAQRLQALIAIRRHGLKAGATAH